MSETKARKLTGKELTWYIIAGTIALLGLIFVIFAIIGDFMPVLSSDNWVAQSEKTWLTNWSPLGYRWWGLIFLGAGTLISVIALSFFAREGDRDEERALRRAQRLAVAAKTTAEEEQPKA
jgi:hypothetical protein